jgi:hypothetical protein
MAAAQNCALPGLQREVQDQSPRTAAHLLRSVLPSARLRATTMVEAASRRAARTRYRLRQGARFYQGAGARTFARSRNHPAPSITAHAKATASGFAPGGKIGSCAAGAEYPRAGPTARRSIDELRRRPKPMSLVTVSVKACKWPERPLGRAASDPGAWIAAALSR